MHHESANEKSRSFCQKLLDYVSDITSLAIASWNFPRTSLKEELPLKSEVTVSDRLFILPSWAVDRHTVA